MTRLKGKIALVTGAAQGIGRAISDCFIREGATVILTDICDDLGASIAKSLGQRAHYKHLDVCDEDKWHEAVDWTLSEFKGLDILVNNAGITGFGEGFGPQDPENISLEDWHKVHCVNMDGFFLGCKQAIRAMKKKGGSIVNISSRSGVVGIPGAAAYASSKASNRNHSKTVALYCAEKKYNIRCNSVHPGAILTPLWDGMLGEGVQRKKTIQAIEEGIPLGRMGTSEEVASMVLYLASDESSFVTGSEFTIDGGILAGAASSPSK
jgi:3(or 17)beta-hydroxysteroid dehydrogenase